MDNEQRKTWARRSAVAGVGLVLLLLLLAILHACQTNKLKLVSAPADHPVAQSGILSLGDAVVTGFSGVIQRNESLPARPEVAGTDETFIDADGPAVRIFDVRRPPGAWVGQYWPAPRAKEVTARKVGQVFGIAIDDASSANIYLAATSLYGLNLVAPSSAYPTRLLRLKRGQPAAVWMAGQFGSGGGFGTVWKIDGQTGTVSKFADITINGIPVGPASLGAIAYDTAHRQLFVSDLTSGEIHRLDLRGRALSSFEHGVVGRRMANLDPIPFDSHGVVNIQDPRFIPADPNTWGFAPASRRVFGLAINPADHRLYYAVGDGQIWSVGLDRNGAFANDPRTEVDLPEGASAPVVSAITFSHDGAMIVAERNNIGTAYDYSPLPSSRVAHVWRFWPVKPFDRMQPRHFYAAAEEYGIGYPGESRNSAGGVALGYGYGGHGAIDLHNCEDTIFFTGTTLRTFHQDANGLQPDGPLVLGGIQISPSRPVRAFNVPASVSYFVNYSDRMDSANRGRMIGDVEVYRAPCTGPDCRPPSPEKTTVASHPGKVASVSGAPSSAPPGVVPNAPTASNTSPTNPGSNPPGGNNPLHGNLTIGCVPGSSGCSIHCPPGTSCLPCSGSNCCPGHNCPHPQPPKMCQVGGTAVCNSATGQWTYQLSSTDPAGIGIDTVTVHSSTNGVSVSNGPTISLIPSPGTLQLSGATPGQTVQIKVCAFKNSDQGTALPYDCCNTLLQIQVPTTVCPIGSP